MASNTNFWTFLEKEDIHVSTGVFPFLIKSQLTTLVFRGLSPDQNEVAVKVTNIINADRKESDFF